VRLLSPLQQVFAVLACGPGKDTFEMHSRLYHLAPGQQLLLAVRFPGAPGLAPLNSQGAFSSQARGSAFQNRRQWKVTSVLPEPTFLPGQTAFLSRISTGIVADCQCLLSENV